MQPAYRTRGPGGTAAAVARTGRTAPGRRRVVCKTADVPSAAASRGTHPQRWTTDRTAVAVAVPGTRPGDMATRGTVPGHSTTARSTDPEAACPWPDTAVRTGTAVGTGSCHRRRPVALKPRPVDTDTDKGTGRTMDMDIQGR